MKRFDANIGSTNAALQEAPKVLKAVGMNLSPRVCFSMIHEVVKVFIIQPIIAAMRIGIELASRFHVLADDRLNVFTAGILKSSQSDFGFAFAVPLQKSKDNNLT